MAKLIDADELYLGKFVEPRTEWHKGWNDALDAASMQSPIVEVVRCRECKYSYCNKYCTNEQWKDNGATVTIEADDFCSYGERKSNE